MNTLADEFIADLGDDVEESKESSEEDEKKEEELDDMQEEEDTSLETLNYTDTKQMAQLVYSKRLRDLIEVQNVKLS
jgi:hypothetical protein